VLALGAWFNNTVCAGDGDEAWLSRTVGDLDGVEACRAHERTVQALLGAMAERPALVVHDRHPDFHSTRVAQGLAEEWGVPAWAVQHHHAHIAAVCAEHGNEGPVLGLALDGVGLGDDGAAWGGELLLVKGAQCQRVGHLTTLPLPGGDRAAREPWRMAAAVLHRLGRSDEIAPRFAHQAAAAGVAHMLRNEVRCPPTSSLGRVFDAAAGLLGLCEVMSSDAEAPIRLERAAREWGVAAPMVEGWRIDAQARLDLMPLLASLVDERDTGRGAARFHATLAAALADWVLRAAAERDIGVVAAGGGCWFNRLLSVDVARRMTQAGLRWLSAQRLLPGDTAIAYGQAVVARQRWKGD